MTTVISVKAKDGIILASDSQGTSVKVKTTIKKVFKINSCIGIGTSGDNSQIELFVDELKQHFDNEIELESEFRNQMSNAVLNLHRIHNHNHSLLCGYAGARLFFSPLSIAAAKPKDGDSYLYRVGFGTMGKNKEVSPYLYKVNKDYVSIGSGSSYARLVLKLQDRFYAALNKKLSDLTIENNVGIASYAINEVKQLDLETGGKTQIAVINHDGYRELSHDDQIKCHQIMIDNIFSSLQENFSNSEKTREFISNLFPHD
jgi:20S proteasome alpha/beta subunit